jgi:hypothetical protein
MPTAKKQKMGKMIPSKNKNGSEFLIF